MPSIAVPSQGGHSVRPQHPGFLRDVVTISDQHTTLSYGKILVREEAKTTYVSPCSQGATFQGGAGSMGSILDDHQTAIAGDGHDDVHLTAHSRIMDRNDGLGLVGDGVEATSFLRGEGVYRTAPRPACILLDLCLPRKNGFQLLEEIKQDESLKDIPVIVMSTSCSEEDILACYRLHANSYIVKSIDFDEFCRSIQSMIHFWFTTAALPAHRE